VRSLLQFLAVWGAYGAFVVASILILVWLFSIDSGRKDKEVASSLFWWALWPLVWLRYRLIGEHSELATSRTGRSRELMGTSEAGTLGRGKHFRTIREAKDYLAGRIAEEAQRDGVPLTEVERKMLYFTETGWTLPDMKQVSSEFDRDYDQGEYEQKIGGLVRKIQSRLRDQCESEGECWDRAIMRLSHGDHYLLVLVDAEQPAKKGAKHNLRVLVIALVLFALVALDQWFRHWMRDH
jgi:hypothetical protein